MSSSVEPVRRQVVVKCSAEHAFRVFTEDVERWWPPEHHIGKSPLARMVVEGRGGGRWYSVCRDGSECDVGKVLVWDPPRRVVFAWQLTAKFEYDPAFVTEVEVTFTPEGPKQTRVELEHRNLDRYGGDEPEVRKSITSPGGWGLTLELFAKAAAA